MVGVVDVQQSGEGGRCNDRFARWSKRSEARRVDSPVVHKHEMEPKIVYIRLEMLSSIYLYIHTYMINCDVGFR